MAPPPPPTRDAFHHKCTTKTVAATRTLPSGLTARPASPAGRRQQRCAKELWWQCRLAGLRPTAGHRAALEERRVRRGVPPDLVQQRGVHPELPRRRGVPPDLVRRRGVPPNLGRRQGIPPDLQRRRGVPPDLRRRQGVPPVSAAMTATPTCPTQRVVNPVPPQPFFRTMSCW
jgi:hypothetical protein